MVSRLLSTFFLASALACAGQTIFEDITDAQQVSYFENSLEYGSGVSAEDFDQDGDIDLFIGSKFNFPSKILENRGGYFVEKNLETDFSVRAALWFDYDGDYDLDLFVCGDNHGNPAAGDVPSDFWRLFINNNGTFQKAQNTGLVVQDDASVSIQVGGLSTADFNLDGYLDLVISVRKGTVYLFMNTGLGSFERVDLGLDNKVYFQPVAFDLNNDALAEIYLPIDFSNPNILLQPDGFLEFTDTAISAGIDNDCDDMGVALGDVENDGDLDIYITCINERGFENVLFLDQSSNSLRFVKSSDAAIGLGGWGWGATFLDVENDRDLDIAATNGHRVNHGYDESKLWLNDGFGNFVDVSQAVQFSDTLMASSLIAFDIDRDGDLDLVQTLKSEFIDFSPFRIYENKAEDHNRGSYLVVQPRMSGPNHWAIGATVKVRKGSATLMRPITAGISFHGQEPAEAFFGLGDWEDVDEVEVIWPGGGRTVLNGISANQIVVVNDLSALHPPSSLKAMVLSESEIEVHWQGMSESETTYVVERSLTPDFDQVISYTVDASQLAFTESGLEPFTTYYYRVRSKKSEEISLPSVAIKAITEGVFMEAPANFSIEMIETTAHLMWEDRSDNEDGFKIERSLDPSFASFIEFVVSRDATSFQNSGLEPNTTYFYRLKGYNDAGESEYTDIETAFVLINPLAVSVGLKIFPNPAGSWLTIELSDKWDSASVRLFTLSGQMVYHSEDPTSGIPLGGLKGTYLVEIISNSGKKIIRKLVVN